MMKSFILTATSIACFLAIIHINIRSDASQLDVLSKTTLKPSQLDIKNISRAINQYYIEEGNKSNPNNPVNYNRSAGEDGLSKRGNALFSEVKTIKLVDFKLSSLENTATVKVNMVSRRYDFVTKTVVAKSRAAYASAYEGFFATKDIKDNYLWKLTQEMMIPEGTLKVEKSSDNKWKVVGTGLGVKSMKSFK